MHTINQASAYQSISTIHNATQNKLALKKSFIEEMGRYQSHPSERDHLSHELRIALTGILGSSYLLEQTGLNDQQKECLNLLNTAANRLLLLAEEL